MRSHIACQAGFTLIELLVALTIVSLLLASAPHFAAALPGLRFRRAVSVLQADLRRAHGVSLATGRVARVHVDAARFGGAVAHVTVTLPGRRPAYSGDVLFWPDGSASSATLRLDGGGRHAVLRVSWLTGDVDAQHQK